MSSEPGAPASAGFIPLSAPEIRGNEWKYVKECLDTGWVSSAGPFVERFERELAARVGTKYAVATVNGTAALHIALLVAGVKPDDEVLVSDLTFIAPANAIRYVGAWPVLIDAEPEYWQMDVGKVEEFLTRACQFRGGRVVNRKTGRRVSALLPVHILGHPVDMDPLLALARKYDLKVIEDATESLGAQYKGRNVGTLGDIACFSFNGNKIITTGGGGMIVTDNGVWAERARYLTTQAKDDPVEYVHNDIGYNYRLTNIQAAVGCAQLEVLDEFILQKRRIAQTYDRLLRGVPGITLMAEAPWAFSTRWLYTVRVNAKRYGRSSRDVLRALAARRIQGRPIWLPVHRNRPYRGTATSRYPVADRLYQECLSLPCSVSLAETGIREVVQTLASRCVRTRV